MLSRRLVVSVALVGLAMTIGLLGLIELGTSRWSEHVGTSIAFTSFGLMLIVAAFECRSETASVFSTATFGSRQMNLVALAEFALALLTTQMDALRRLLGTTDLDAAQLAWAFLPPAVLLVLWEAAKLIARTAPQRQPQRAPHG